MLSQLVKNKIYKRHAKATCNHGDPFAGSVHGLTIHVGAATGNLSAVQDVGVVPGPADPVEPAAASGAVGQQSAFAEPAVLVDCWDPRFHVARATPVVAAAVVVATAVRAPISPVVAIAAAAPVRVASAATSVAVVAVVGAAG